ncbi:YceD family protein [Marinospirillum perlucidum]|uniref:YceD family protein n=1 Tax=Marinospirillum perlucidum TaxID=1982602 RepID=UPI000DF27EB3|nr:YceD family protein [Marinospirillum perlucidum]
MANDYLQEPLDPYKYCAAEREISVELPLESMQRASDLLLDNDGRIKLTLKFSFSSQRLMQVEGRLTGEVTLECQRCLGPTRQALDTEFLWGLVTTEEAASNLPRTHEPVFIENDRLQLLPVIGDEFLLALPLVAYHPEDECQLQSFEQDQPLADKPAEEKTNPFGALADLKKSLKTKQ